MRRVVSSRIAAIHQGHTDTGDKYNLPPQLGTDVFKAELPKPNEINIELNAGERGVYRIYSTISTVFLCTNFKWFENEPAGQYLNSMIGKIYCEPKNQALTRLRGKKALRGGGEGGEIAYIGTYHILGRVPVPMYAIFLVYVTVIHTLLILGNVFVTCVTYHWNQRILLNKVDYLLDPRVESPGLHGGIFRFFVRTFITEKIVNLRYFFQFTLRWYCPA
ncbi:hypothetical protein PROFUN_04057, partial [Planoprotostelium fungivorum]